MTIENIMTVSSSLKIHNRLSVQKLFCLRRLWRLSFFVCLFLSPFQAYAVTVTKAQERCEALSEVLLPETSLNAIGFVAAQDSPSDHPKINFCRIQGYVRPAIHFEIRLPTSFWNERMMMVGCDGFCGQIQEPPIDQQDNSILPALARGYATVMTDSGHWGASPSDGLWAYGHPAAKRDWANRSVAAVANAAKEVIKAFYDEDLRFSYFKGCGNGGRMALIAAQRYPELFQGIIAQAPVTQPSTLYGIHYAWIAKQLKLYEDPPLITEKTLQHLGEEVLQACDGLDGHADGLIADPRACRFHPDQIQCPKTESATSCLKETEKQALAALYNRPIDTYGKALIPGGLMPGSEPYWIAWYLKSPWQQKALPSIQDETPSLGALARLNQNFLRYLAFEQDMGPSYPGSDFDFERDPPLLDAMAGLYAADNPDLSAFQQQGGKLLLLQSWADAMVPPAYAIAYYKSVMALLTEKKNMTEEQISAFFRLFMLPGQDHCRMTHDQGPNFYDAFTTIEEWVEQNQAPEHLLGFS